MGSCILIADKSVPLGVILASALRSRDASVAIISDVPESNQKKGEKKKEGPADKNINLADIPWNRSSSLSARTILLEIKNTFSSCSQAVLFFDIASFFENTIQKNKYPLELTAEYAAGYILLVQEIVSCFKTQGSGRIVFAVRDSSFSAVQNGWHGIALSAAEAAFIKLAEETAALFTPPYNTNPALQTMLVRFESGDDAGNAAWLADSLMQAAPSRHPGRWIKGGSRGFFGKL
ncbi:hypothetical protein K7I13_06695 [Brucepastera parasyntrophica]|uniref:hypothetical protein n=1 Tax=Brucepastera parasyntrophica TaxID=2880008 RepID=UPI00210B7C19|nr:hypothetical protein [Brucepastera parasyntrophica]ULQ60937.1 hypothetical protein K7I13_06695 [Brucepastera parasyntrophica]